jgi:hypothetical protein
MKWSDVGKKIADFAPALGTAIGGPLGAGLGSIVAGVFGTEPTPDAVMQAITVDPQAAVKLREIEANERIEIERILSTERASNISNINKTMQAESKSEHWMQWSWRPFWGFISALAFLFVCTLACYLGYQAIIEGKPEAMVMLPQFITAMATLFAIPGAILGVASWHRGKQKRGV